MTALMWARTDVPGSEFVMRSAADGLHLRGSQHAVDPVPYRLTYELRLDAVGAASSFTAHAEGDGWSRQLELVRSGDAWSSHGAAIGGDGLAAFDGRRVRAPAPPGIGDPASLHRVLDVDLGGSPATNTLAVRRLRLLDEPVGHVERIVSAWVLPPTLEVIAAPQTYAALGRDRIGYGDAGTAVEVLLDRDGWVLDYPGLARRVG